MQLDEIGPDLRVAFDQVETQRKAHGIPQAQLARKAELSEATYNRLLKLKERVPYRRTVVKLRRALTEIVGDFA
jgi:transcriptional regulator with XRE-family HTH domain